MCKNIHSAQANIGYYVLCSWLGVGCIIAMYEYIIADKNRREDENHRIISGLQLH